MDFMEYHSVMKIMHVAVSLFVTKGISSGGFLYFRHGSAQLIDFCLLAWEATRITVGFQPRFNCGICERAYF